MRAIPPQTPFPMNRLTLLTLALLAALPYGRLRADDGIDQGRLTEAEFRAKQQEYITESAQLTEAEAERFFPVYFELQDKKKELNAKTRELNRRDHEEDLSEADYHQLLDEMYATRQQSERLEQEYYERFKKILSYKKIFLVQRAEMRFHMDIVKGMKPGGGGGKGGGPGGGPRDGGRPPR